jgi:uncharacterized protein with beta-barrel porin domain
MATLNRNLVRPELCAAWQHDYGDVAYPIDSQFASDAGGLFTAHAATSSRNGAFVSAAVAVQQSECVSTYVYHDG